jgi:aminoglycoside phosphotransferase (APT) family kinase protein
MPRALPPPRAATAPAEDGGPRVPVPPQRDPEVTRARLLDWFRDRNPGADEVSVSDPDGPAATGYSHETLIFDAGWTVAGERIERRLVARVKPSTHSIFLEDRFEDEYRLAETLSGHTDVPVPALVGYEPDSAYFGAPFYVMEAVEGSIPSDNPPYTFGGWLLEAASEDQAAVWWSGLEAMAAVHRVDWRGLDLGFAARGAPGPDGELEYYGRYLDWVRRDQPFPEAEDALDWLRANRPTEDGPLSLCWGDSRPGNQIFRDFRCVALLDWEMAAVADAAQDLAWWLYFDRLFSEGLGVPRPAGFPTHEETIVRHEELVGSPARNLGYYEVFAAFRFAAVMLRVSQMMILYQQLPPDSDFGTNSFAVQMLSKVLDEARDRSLERSER